VKQEINGLWGGRVWRFDELPSTNTWAMEHVSALGHGDVVWAVSQTDGRGRMGRNWISSPGRCLTVSLVIDDPALARLGVNLGQIAACAVVDLLGLCGIKGSLKWPNDVLVDGGKIAGLLVERDAVSGFFVLGVGLNINLTSGELSAARLHRPATSMQVIAGREFDGEALLTPLLQCLERRLDGAREEGLAPTWETWGRLDWLKGRMVSVTTVDGVVEGECLGMDAEGRLRLRLAGRKEETFWTGDVERVGLTGLT
jgi:BirA family biotin operon repressor/biotin-[acetyl-CoA-carboxylase] ligase